jgi:hypothetical protein
MRSRLIVSLLIATAVLSGPARAQQPAECTQFDWPLATELAWFRSPSVETLKSGETLAGVPAVAITLALTPMDKTTYPTALSRPDKADGGYGGFITFGEAPRAGEIQVTVSAESWVDVAQNGASLELVSRTRDRTCSEIRKSLRFKVAAGPFSVLIGGAKSDTIRVAVRAAD